MKYYYTDPISARHMAERYGIKYITASGETVEIAADGFYVGGKSLINGYKLYVAEEQHHLFKAVDGDVLEVDRFYYDRIRGDVPQDFPCHNVYPTVRTSKRFVSMSTPGVGYDNYFNDQHDDFSTPYKIIMRGGKHFFMPEVGG